MADRIEYRYHTADVQIHSKGCSYADRRCTENKGMSHGGAEGICSMIASSVFGVFNYMTVLSSFVKNRSTICHADRSSKEPGACSLHSSNSVNSEEQATDNLHDWQTIEIIGATNLESLLMKVLEETLFLFHSCKFIVTKIRILNMNFKDSDFLEDDLSENSSASDDENYSKSAMDKLSEALSDSSIDNCGLNIKFVVFGDFWKRGVHPAGTEIKAITWSNFSVIYDSEDASWHSYFIVDI